MSINNNKILEDLMSKYKMNAEEKEELRNTIKKILIHPEFQKRMSNDFPHHDKIPLGEHILEDTVVTFILSKRYIHDENYNIHLALLISMFHDLYIEPWQNNQKNKNNLFHNKHGFRHPIEAIIAAITWFPEYFEDLNDAKIIIDGVIHHMFPLPVRRVEVDENNIMELNNWEDFKNIKPELLELIIDSSNRHKIRYYSLSKSIYKEGRVMSKADKIVSKINMKESSLKGIIALLTGKNNNLSQ